MGVFAILNCLIYCFFGLLTFYHVRKNWDDSKKRPYRYSEMVNGVLFFVMGFMYLTFLNGYNIPETTKKNVNLISFVVIIAILVWIELLNITKWRVRVSKDSKLRKERNYNQFLEKLENAYQNSTHRKDIVKDLSRKFLHLVVLAIVFAIPAIANSKVLENSLARWQLPPIVFRNTVYLLAAGFFILMFTYADYWRLNDFSVLPNWAHKWYFKSLDPTSEKHTFISSVPFLLAFVSVLHAPHISIVYGAAVISCVADSVASVIGKSFGDHKMEKFGLFPNKSLEGLVAGAFSAYIGVFLVFHNCLPASTTTWDNMFALVGAVIFVIVDAYGKAIADNILNTLIPAFSFWFMYSIM